MDFETISFQCTQIHVVDLIQSFAHVTLTLLSVMSCLRIADVGKLLKQVNPYSGMGPDDIHPLIRKEIADNLSLPTFFLLTYTRSTQVLPAALKEV